MHIQYGSVRTMSPTTGLNTHRKIKVELCASGYFLRHIGALEISFDWFDWLIEWVSEWLIYTRQRLHMQQHYKERKPTMPLYYNFSWPYDAHKLSLGSVHFLFAVLLCRIVFLLHFVISTVIKLSDVHSSHVYLAVHFPHSCYPIYSLTL